MASRLTKWIPVFIALAVLAMVVSIRLWQRSEARPDLLNRLEWASRDWRVRLATKQPSLVHSNFGAVYLDEGALWLFNNAPGVEHAYPLPRLIYGQVVRELKAQQARAVAFDMLFLDQARDKYAYYNRTNLSAPRVSRMDPADTNLLSSDGFFADQLREAGNVILAVPPNPRRTNGLIFPPPIFRTNALALGHVVGVPDADGIHRRIQVVRKDPETGERVWAMGIVMAAAELGLDLEHEHREPGHILLQSTNRPGLARRIPVDDADNLTVDWALAANDARLMPTKRSPRRHRLDQPQPAALAGSAPTATIPAPTIMGTMWDLFVEDMERTGRRRPIESRYQDAIVLVGSVGLGRNVSDRGPTPVQGNDFLFSIHWNIANSLLVDRFVRSVSLPQELGLIAGMVAAAGLLTWRLRALWSSVFVLLAGVGYTWFAVWAYAQHRQLVPLVLPIGGALLMTHVCLVAYRMIFEQAERRRIKSAFSKFVAPDVLELILEERQESLLGAQRELTVFFADVRNFTGFIDASHDRAEALARKPGLTLEQAASFRDQVARDTMMIVNEYLTVTAEVVKENGGTVDKYIGDSVMAFWGAPPPKIEHAHLAVQAAVAAQRAIQRVNAEHEAENRRREAGNERRLRAGEIPLALLPILQIGIGVHTGTAIAGFMGSRKNLTNYTVFGRDVIIASRLENLAEPGAILISGATQAELLRSAPALAASCAEVAPVRLKGLALPLAVFEVPWRDMASSPHPVPPS